MKIICILVSIFCTTLWSCKQGKKNLTNDELKWLSVYKVGDTLIFKSDKGQLDSSFIIESETHHSEYRQGVMFGSIWYKNKQLASDTQGIKLVEIIKHNSRETTLAINYLYGRLLIVNINTEFMQLRKKGKIYEFNTYHPNGEPDRPKMIYWDEDLGIVKYITYDNTIWERVNTPK